MDWITGKGVGAKGGALSCVSRSLGGAERRRLVRGQIEWGYPH